MAIEHKNPVNPYRRDLQGFILRKVNKTVGKTEDSGDNVDVSSVFFCKDARQCLKHPQIYKKDKRNPALFAKENGMYFNAIAAYHILFCLVVSCFSSLPGCAVNIEMCQFISDNI